MKTEDFVAALGNINEKYVREMLEEDAAAGDVKDRAVFAGSGGGRKLREHQRAQMVA